MDSSPRKKFLEENSLSRFYDLLVNQLGCEFEDFKDIDEKFLKENNVKPMQIKKIMNAINNLKNTPIQSQNEVNIEKNNNKSKIPILLDQPHQELLSFFNSIKEINEEDKEKYREKFSRSKYNSFDLIEKMEEKDLQKMQILGNDKKLILNAISILKKMSERPIAIGIDLGSSYSCVAVWRDEGRIEILSNEYGLRTTSSCVSFTEKEILVGDEASNQSSFNALNTIFGSKRLIGKDFKDNSVQQDLKFCPYKVINDSGKPKIQVNYKSEIKIFSPEEINELILKKMKEISEFKLGFKINNAVISVPSYFNYFQRQSIRESGITAGLNVKRIISVSSASSFPFGVDDESIKNEEKIVMVFDMGAATLSISILALEDGMYEPKATSGNNHLGGENFNHRMIEYFVQVFKRKHNCDLTSNPTSLSRLRNACERAKKILSSEPQASIELDSLFDGIDFISNISIFRFEELCRDLFNSILAPVEKVLADSKLQKNEIQEVILMGGSTRIPKIRSLLTQFFDGKKLNTSYNPDESVAYGAAIQGAILSGRKGEMLSKTVFIDITPYSYGVEIEGELMHALIPRNAKIPIQKEEYFSTFEDNQTEVSIRVFEGEYLHTKNNNFLCSFNFDGITSAPRGVAKIKVSFAIDEDDVFNVTAIDQSTGKSKKIQITKDSSSVPPGNIKKIILFQDENVKN